MGRPPSWSIRGCVPLHKGAYIGSKDAEDEIENYPRGTPIGDGVTSITMATGILSLALAQIIGLCTIFLLGLWLFFCGTNDDIRS